MTKRALTPGYIFFFILFLPDSWQVIIGLAASWFFTPTILSPETNLLAEAVLYVMVATIGYAASSGPARGLTKLLKKSILGDRAPH